MKSRTGPESDRQASGGDARRAPLGVLLGHVAFTILNAVLFGNTLWLMPMLVRLHFGDADENIRDWQTALVTASLASLMIVSVFWGELLRRVSTVRYLAIWWLVAVLPFLVLSLAQNYAQMLACHLVAAVGFAGWMPLDGKLLKHFYPDSVRGRVFGVLNAAKLGGAALAVFLVGRWLETDEMAFRYFFVVAVLLQAAAMMILYRLVLITGADRIEPAVDRHRWSDLFQPVLHMGEILRADRNFLWYELAFMTYGGAFMICDALLPIFATARLGMGYESFSHSTQMIRSLAMLVMILPMGWLLDRIGAVRTSGIAFAVLACYPVTLLLADNVAMVGFASGIFGVGLAGVMMGWMLGPVALAPTSEKVPQYVAIHASLVGVRGIVFQGLGLVLYKVTSGFELPFGVAAAAFLLGALQMWRLHKRQRATLIELTPEPQPIVAVDKS